MSAAARACRGWSSRCIARTARSTCVDSVGKKAAFITQAAGALRPARTCMAVHARVERLRREPFDVITSRAFASLADFVAADAASARTRAGIWMAMKGKTPDDEIGRRCGPVSMFHVEPLACPELDAQSGALSGSKIDQKRAHAYRVVEARATRSRDDGSSASPTRKAASARPRRPSISPPAWPSSAGASWSSTSIRKATRPWARASTSARSTSASTTSCSRTRRSPRRARRSPQGRLRRRRRQPRARRRRGRAGRPRAARQAPARRARRGRRRLRLRPHRLPAEPQPADAERPVRARTASSCRCSASTSRSKACRDLVNTIKQVHANLNPALEVIGILRVMFDARITLQPQVSEQLKAHFGDKVFDTVIPRNVRLAEAPSYGLPGVVFDPASKGALAFLDFAREMAARADALRAEPVAEHDRRATSRLRRRAARPHRGCRHQRQRAARAALGRRLAASASRPARPSARAASRRSPPAGSASTTSWRSACRSSPTPGLRAVSCASRRSRSRPGSIATSPTAAWSASTTRG